MLTIKQLHAYHFYIHYITVAQRMMMTSLWTRWAGQWALCCTLSLCVMIHVSLCEPAWEPLPATLYPPPTRHSYSSALATNTSVCAGECWFVFGGRTVASENMNDLWTFSIEAQIWTRVLVTGDLPPTRRRCGMVVYQNILYIWGGYQGSRADTRGTSRCFLHIVKSGLCWL